MEVPRMVTRCSLGQVARVSIILGRPHHAALGRTLRSRVLHASLREPVYFRCHSSRATRDRQHEPPDL
jgi:hypothetical protein